MAKIRFFESNSINVRRVQDFTEQLQSDNTRLYYDFDYTSVSNSCYFTKILKTDNLWLQFRSSTETYQAYLIDTDGVQVDINSSISPGITLDNGTKQYELALDLSSYSGKYYITFEFESLDSGVYNRNNFQSEWFDIITDTTDHLKIEWKNNGFQPYNDGVIWSQTQKIWVESTIVDYVPIIQKTVFTTENNKLITTRAVPFKQKKWQLELIPDYLLEKLNIAMGHDYFYINSIRYNSEETFDNERQGDTRLYSSSIVLQLVEDQNSIGYEDYSDDPELIGDIFTPPQELRTTGLDTRTTGLADRTTNT